jgi:hypothetical protein
VELTAFGASGREQKQGFAFPESSDLSPIRAELFDRPAIPVIPISHKISSIFSVGHVDNYLACEVGPVSTLC